MERIKAITNIPGWFDELTGSGIPKTTDALYSKVPLIHRCIRLRADALSAVPVKIIKGTDTESDWPYPEPLETLLWKAEASLLMTGGGFWEIVRNESGYQKNVKYRNPLTMAVKYQDGRLIFKQGTVEWVNDPAAGTYEMVYFADYDPTQDVLPGVGALEAATTDGQLLAALAKFPQSYFEGGAMPVTLLGVDTPDPGELSRLESWFKRAATGIKNAFKVLAFRNGSMTATTLTPPLKELAMPELSQEARKNILTVFGVPESMVDTNAANFATAQEARLGYYEDVIKPRARMFEGVINEQLLAKDGLRLEFAFGEMPLFQEDEADRAGVLKDLTEAGMPLRLAVDLAGYNLTDDQLALLEMPEPERQPEEQQQQQPMQQPMQDNMMQDELRRYQRVAVRRVMAGKPQREFESAVLSPVLLAAIAGQLESAKDAGDVRAVFKAAIDWQGYP